MTNVCVTACRLRLKRFGSVFTAGRMRMKMREKRFWVVKNSGWYRKDGKDLVFDNKKEAEKVARQAALMRARVWVEEVEEGEFENV